MNPSIIGAIAGILALLQAVPFIYSTLRGHTRPERATYAIWSVVNCILLFSYLSAGATTTAGVNAAYTFTTLLILVLSIHHGVGGFTKLDLMSFVLAGLSIVLWVNTSNPLVALYLSMLVKFIGVIPTIVKTYYRPDTENSLSWAMCAAASTLNLFALTKFFNRDCKSTSVRVYYRRIGGRTCPVSEMASPSWF